MMARLVGLLMLAWMACSDSKPQPQPDAGVPTLACAHREDCPGGQICTQERFCAPCESNGQCRLKELCAAETRVCTWRAGWGAECARNEECSLGAWCHQGLASHGPPSPSVSRRNGGVPTGQAATEQPGFEGDSVPEEPTGREKPHPGCRLSG